MPPAAMAELQTIWVMLATFWFSAIVVCRLICPERLFKTTYQPFPFRQCREGQLSVSGMRTVDPKQTLKTV